jgi:hypothetical protein
VVSILPAFAADSPTVAVLSIKPGQTVTGAQIPVKVNVSNFTVECADVGKPGEPGRGHVHAMLDGMNMEHLTNFYCGTSFAISGMGLQPGKHTLAVTLASDAHEDVGKAAMVSFEYQPETVKLLPEAMTGGQPSVAISEPKSGAQVPKTFNLVVNVKNFDLSCDLEGKSNVDGWGHLHVFVHQAGVTDVHMHPMSQMPKEKSMSGMMSMVGMVGMPCTTTVPIDLSTWHSGKAHLLVMLANNDHNPVKGAGSAAVDVTVK